MQTAARLLPTGMTEEVWHDDMCHLSVIEDESLFRNFFQRFRVPPPFAQIIDDGRRAVGILRKPTGMPVLSVWNVANRSEESATDLPVQSRALVRWGNGWILGEDANFRSIRGTAYTLNVSWSRCNAQLAACLDLPFYTDINSSLFPDRYGEYLAVGDRDSVEIYDHSNGLIREVGRPGVYNILGWCGESLYVTSNNGVLYRYFRTHGHFESAEVYRAPEDAIWVLSQQQLVSGHCGVGYRYQSRGAVGIASEGGLLEIHETRLPVQDIVITEQRKIVIFTGRQLFLAGNFDGPWQAIASTETLRSAGAYRGTLRSNLPLRGFDFFGNDRLYCDDEVCFIFGFFSVEFDVRE
jgi:hypothetical protein